MSDERSYPEILSRVAELAERLLAHDDPSVSADAEELVDWLDVFHREGLGRFVEMIRQWRGELFLEQAALDPIVGELLETYSLGVDVDASTVDAVVQIALDDVRPYVHSHGGEIEVLDVTDGVVALRMHGSCNGCTAADDTVTRRIEVSLREHWVDFRRVDVEDATREAHPPPATGEVVTGLGITARPSSK